MIRSLALSCSLVLILAPAAQAQQPLRVKIDRDKVMVGFQKSGESATGLFLPGMWTTLYVPLVEAADGPIILHVGKDGVARGELIVECGDNHDVQTTLTVPFRLSKQDLRILTYIKPAGRAPQIKLTIKTKEQTVSTQVEHPTSLNLSEHLYIVLGDSPPQLTSALRRMSGNPEPNAETRGRHAGFEIDVERMPTQWYGYSGVDLVVLTTENDKFLEKLLEKRDQPQIRALAEWVKRGGRLLVSVSWRNQHLVERLLKLPAWQPALPEIVPANAQVKLRSLFSVQRPGAKAEPFVPVGAETFVLPHLQRHDQVEVMIKEEPQPGFTKEETPILARFPYGLGSVSLLALDVTKEPFTKWSGNIDFWETLVTRLAPRGPRDGQAGGRDFGQPGNDLTSLLYDQLDHFDTPPISFGWVAFFILLYILVVGPLDYIILKKVFKRLEWTWVTFPAIVLGVSATAYFTAYAIKGSDQKINQLDLIDIDLRTDLDANGRTKQAYVYGTSWFMIFSPRIDNYTVGLMPALPAWQEGAKADTPGLVSWQGKRESERGPTGGPRGQVWHRRAYEYARQDATDPDSRLIGLKDVPIPVWTSKAFTATWEAQPAQLPFAAKLEYDPDNRDRPLFGTIQSRLPVNLEDVVLIYGKKWLSLQPLRAGAEPQRVVWEVPLDFNQWAGDARHGGWHPGMHDQQFHPTAVAKTFLFHEACDLEKTWRNHELRMLDQSWRLRDAWQRDSKIREAILVARLPRSSGSAESLTEAKERLPTHLWIHGLPDGQAARPKLSGTLNHETFIRVYLPVTPKEK